MIKFFREIRNKLLAENRLIRYLIYAIGEIILVVFGILIALQVNNWNQDRIQKKELDGLIKSISSAIQSDIKYLKLIRTGRKIIGEKTDSIISTYLDSQKPVFNYNDYAYIATTFDEMKNIIYYQPNTSAFEALKNSIYLSKLQGTDFELLLNSFYTGTERLQKQEDDYNQSLNTDYQAWFKRFRNKDGDLFMKPWEYLASGEIQDQFLKVLKDERTKTVLYHGYKEFDMIDLYDQQIVIGEKYIEMVEKGEVNFDEQTRINFSGTFYSYAEVDVLNLLVNGKIPSGFGVIYAQSSQEFFPGIKFEGDAMILTYP